MTDIAEIVARPLPEGVTPRDVIEVNLMTPAGTGSNAWSVWVEVDWRPEFENTAGVVGHVGLSYLETFDTDIAEDAPDAKKTARTLAWALAARFGTGEPVEY